MKSIYRRSPLADAMEENMSADLEEGDHAVHLNYGICVYRGLKTITDKTSTYEAMEAGIRQ